MIYYADHLKAAFDQSYNDGHKIPTKNANVLPDGVRVRSGQQSSQFFAAPTSDQPYANLALAIKESQITTQNIIDHELYPKSMQNYVLAS